MTANDKAKGLPNKATEPGKPDELIEKLIDTIADTVDQAGGNKIGGGVAKRADLVRK